MFSARIALAAALLVALSPLLVAAQDGQSQLAGERLQAEIERLTRELEQAKRERDEAQAKLDRLSSELERLRRDKPWPIDRRPIPYLRFPESTERAMMGEAIFRTRQLKQENRWQPPRIDIAPRQPPRP